MAEIENQPFDDSAVLFRFTPTEEEKGPKGSYWDVAEEYVVAAYPKSDCGIVVYAKYRDIWHANPWNNRAIIARLLADRNEILT